MRALLLAVALIAGAVSGPAASAAPKKPLAGHVVIIDPGHQLGNSRHLKQINRLVGDGNGGRKACNTTGTATHAGYPESTFTWGVATRLRTRLQKLGATVVMTRYENSTRLWGPCVDARGKLGNAGYRGRERTADLKISLHGDGAAAKERGFHLIIHPTHAPSRTRSFAHHLRDALVAEKFALSTYTGGTTRIVKRTDLATINHSHMPVVMAELGNMRNHADATVMRTATGQGRYARAIAVAVRAQLAG